MAMILFLVLCFGLSCYGVEGIRSISNEQMQTQPLALHKPAPFNEIQAKNNYEYDCVDINKQPAFNHPLLKNHKIQMSPSFQSKLKKNNASTFGKVSEIGVNSEGCPPGSVPIRRNPLDPTNIHPLTASDPGQHFATLMVPWDGTAHYGARAQISLVNPRVEMDQISMAQIWMYSGPLAEFNSIQFGWAVNPRMYGDSRTRLTASWTADDYQKTGCYNAVCPGFVQVDTRVFLGAAFDKTSIFLGDQYIADLTAIQDKPSGNWWLIFNNAVKIGYWPKEIFTHLANGASEVRYGGSTVYSTPGRGISPPMGFGTWPDNRYQQDGYFSNVQIVNDAEKLNLVDVENLKVGKYVDADSCYELKYWDYQGEVMRQTFTYGGPGGECGPA